MILVTGATGFIGGHLVETLCASGERVRCLLRRPARTALPSAAEVVLADLSSPRSLPQALEGVDAVIHLAGTTKALAPAEYYTGNAAASENLARAAAGRPLRFVHVSSLAAIGPSPDGAPLREDAGPNPVTHYGISKLQGEQAVLAAIPDAVIVRPPVVYGPRDTDVFQLLQSVCRGLVVEIAGGPRWFSAIYVHDLVRGLITCARHPQARGAYFLSHPKALTWSEFGAAAAAIVGRRPRTVTVPVPLAFATGLAAECWSRMRRRPGIVSRDKIREALFPHWTCDPSRAAADLGFAAATSIGDGLAHTLSWYKEAGWLNY